MAVDGRAGRARAARGLDRQQAGRGRSRPRASPGAGAAVIELVDSRAPPLSGRPPRRRLDRADPAHQRRRARQPAHAPALRGAEDLPRAAAPAAGDARARAAARRASSSRTGRPRRREVRRVGAAGDRDHDPRGAQPPGAADGSRRSATRSSTLERIRVRPAASSASSARGRRGGSRAAEVRRLWKDAAADGAQRTDERRAPLGRARRDPGRAQRRARRSSPRPRS